MDFSKDDPKELHEWKLNRATALATHESHRATAATLLESSSDFAVEAIRTAVILNGGAVIACLTFLSGLYQSSGSPQGLLVAISWATAFSALGAIAAGVASGMAYFTQTFFYLEHQHVQLTWKHPYQEDKPGRTWRKLLGEVFRGLSCLLVLTSYGLLVGGVCVVSKALLV